MNEQKILSDEDDDENLIVLPDGFNESIITKAHFARVGENIKTCNMVIQDPINKIGKEEVICPDCGRKFKIVKQSDIHKELDK